MRHHSDWIAAYVNLFAQRTEAPAILHFWTAVATIAGALTRNVWIDELLFKFYPNFYILFVAHPGGATKSTTMSLGINMLRQLDHIYLAANNTTYPAFIRDLAKHNTLLLEERAEDMADSTFIRQCAVTAAISEFGTFLKAEDEEMLNGLTDLWDCGALHVKDTKTNGTDIVEHPFVNIIGCTTPAWAQKKLPNSIGGWGLSSRIIFIHALGKERNIARPSKMWKPGEYERMTAALLDDLRHISELHGPMEFSPAADQLVETWYAEQALRTAAFTKKPDHDPWTAHFLARKQAHIHKLVMILSVSRRDTLQIEEDDLKEAITRIDAIETEIPKVFAGAAEPTALARTEQAILQQIIDEALASPDHRILRLTAINRLARYVDSPTASRIIDSAISRQIFRTIQTNSTGRPLLWLEIPSPDD